MACISAAYEEAEFRWRSATVVLSMKKATPTLFSDLESSALKQRIGLANELIIFWK